MKHAVRFDEDDKNIGDGFSNTRNPDIVNEPAYQDTVRDKMLASEDRQDIMRALERILEEDNPQILDCLRRLTFQAEGLSIEEIAMREGITPGSMKDSLCKCRKRMKRYL